MATILLDLDGTLIDPAPGIVAAYRWALESLGRPMPDDDLLWVIGPPLRESFARLLGGVAEVETAIGAYRDYIQERGLTQAAVYEGVEAALAGLKAEHGGGMFLCTSKSHQVALDTVRHFRLGAYFDGVYGAEPDGRLENKTDLIAHVLTMEKRGPAGAVMVGDHAQDMIGAVRNKIPAIGVTWGYGTAAELTDAGAFRLCNRVQDLHPLVSKVLASIL